MCSTDCWISLGRRDAHDRVMSWSFPKKNSLTLPESEAACAISNRGWLQACGKHHKNLQDYRDLQGQKACR